MTYSVYQHWDPLKVCAVGRSYPPEFYSWMTNSKTRNLFERIATETEEDFQAIIKKLKEFGVEILRPDIPENMEYHQRITGHWPSPPMCPRDYTVVIGDTLYENYFTIKRFYDNIRDSSWPDCNNINDFVLLPEHIKQECLTNYGLNLKHLQVDNAYDNIINQVRSQYKEVKHITNFSCNGAMITRVGKDLYFGTETYRQPQQDLQQKVDAEFPNYRNHIVNTGGHSDSTFCPVTPGLIVSLHDVPTYADTFPDWEVVYLPHQSWEKVTEFLELKKKNKGRWWIPGFENDDALIETVDTWLNHWVGYVEETVFDVNMLIIDPKNVMVFNYNKQVFDALDRYGITPHIVLFRHRYFWDGGIHCVTSDLHREGTQQDYFTSRINQTTI